eukprot:249905-Prymnesium_polylepis.1
MSIEGLINAKSRWRQLRSGAGALESILWTYRARVGNFELDENRRDSNAPEAALCRIVNEWRDELVAGASLATTSLKKVHPPEVYKHFQDSGEPELGQDDHQSPVQPHRYIAMRIRPTMRFYQDRIPQYTRQGYVMKAFILSFGVTASILARDEQVSWVAVVTAAASALTSWVEFSDTARKTERYTHAVNSLEKLLYWWDSLSEVQKGDTGAPPTHARAARGRGCVATPNLRCPLPSLVWNVSCVELHLWAELLSAQPLSHNTTWQPPKRKGNISNLIRTGESVISEERLAWTSTANVKQEAGDGTERGDGAQNSGAKQQKAVVSDAV